jgi:hypothetical protein
MALFLKKDIGIIIVVSEKDPAKVFQNTVEC